jgi:tetratricopeptide (TPR) repeat protein
VKISEEEFRKRIERNLRRLNRDKAMWDKIVPEQIPSTYYDMGFDSRGIAIYTLLLGNINEAINWFEKAAEYFEEHIVHQRSRTGTWEGESGRCTDFLDMAILSGNDKLTVEAVKRAQEIDRKFPVRYPDPAQNYYYLLALSNTLSLEEKKAKNLLEKIDVKFHKGYEDYFNGLKESVKGLLKNDMELVLDGITQILTFHTRKYGTNPVTDDELVCIPATVLLLLAINKGIKIKAADIEEKYRKYIPWILLD